MNKYNNATNKANYHYTNITGITVKGGNVMEINQTRKYKINKYNYFINLLYIYNR